MKTFISGLGINLKTSALNKLEELGYQVYKSSSNDYIELTRKMGYVVMDTTPMLLNKLMEVRMWYGGVVDRSPIDQLCISQIKSMGLCTSKSVNNPYTYDQESYFLDKYKEYIGDNVSHILLSMEDESILHSVIDREDFYDTNRYWVYDSVERYIKCRVAFNELYVYYLNRIGITPEIVHQVDGDFDTYTSQIINLVTLKLNSLN